MFIDARKVGRMETRVHRVFDPEDIGRVAGTYHAWRGKGGKYEDGAGFCKAVAMEEIAGHGFVLTPGRYVGAEEVEEDGEEFGEKMGRLTASFHRHLEVGRSLDERIVGFLREICRGN